MSNIAFYSTKKYDQDFFDRALKQQFPHHKITYFEDSLNTATAKATGGFGAVCVFVNDEVDKNIIETLKENGVQLIALRCAGFNNVDMKAAFDCNIPVVRVPAYSPYAVAEHAVAMIMTLNRKTHRAFNRVREGNFALNGLLGFDLKGKTIGVIGTGKIGQIFCKIMLGFGTNVIAYDPFPDTHLEATGVSYYSPEDLFKTSDIISLQCPLNDDTHHIINSKSLDMMKPGVMIINTSRGGLLDTKSIISGLKSGQVGYLGIDVYEQEEGIFFHDYSDRIVQDDVIMRLITFPNVLITSHQAFFTDTALENISETTLQNIDDFEKGIKLKNEIKYTP